MVLSLPPQKETMYYLENILVIYAVAHSAVLRRCRGTDGDGTFNVFSDERRYVYDAVCRGCGQCWWTPQRLQQHLRYSRKQPGGCFDIVRRYYAPLQTPVKFHIPDELQRVHRLPKCQVAGPTQEHLVPLWRQRQIAKLQELIGIGKEKGYALLDADEHRHATDAAFNSATARWAHASCEDIRCWTLMISS